MWVATKFKIRRIDFFPPVTFLLSMAHKSSFFLVVAACMVLNYVIHKIEKILAIFYRMTICSASSSMSSFTCANFLGHLRMMV